MAEDMESNVSLTHSRRECQLALIDFTLSNA